MYSISVFQYLILVVMLCIFIYDSFLIDKCKLTIINGKADVFKLETYGLSIYVSEDCLPPDLKECNLFVKANLTTNVALPSGSILASAVYHITTVPAIERFNQHVEISMVHCANDFSQLNFVIAKEQVPYKFEYLEGGMFEVDAKTGMKVGRIHVSSFSSWAIVAFKYIQRTFQTLLGYKSTPPNNPVVPDNYLHLIIQII